jgi:tol-pal system protein YbgF
MHRKTIRLIFTVLLAISAAASLGSLSSCRTSQQEARRNANVHTRLAQGQAVLGQQVDSLLLIESKLIEVIDSMTDLVDVDHARIQALEHEVEMMKSRRTAGGPFDGTRSAMTARAPIPAPQYVPPTAPDATSPSSEPTSSSAPAGHEVTPSALQDRYAAALRLFNNNSFSAALTAFRSLEADDPNGAYASNYKYWEGECYYAEKQYNQALQAFGTVLSEYPHTVKAPAAQFKIGESYERLNLIPSARSAYQRLLDDYPTSEFRARARARLSALQ